MIGPSGFGAGPKPPRVTAVADNGPVVVPVPRVRTACGLCGLKRSAPRHRRRDLQSYHPFEEPDVDDVDGQRPPSVDHVYGIKRDKGREGFGSGLETTKPVGSSPALRIACPVCAAPPGAYCMKGHGRVQVIAHKKRREAEEKSR